MNSSVFYNLSTAGYIVTLAAYCYHLIQSKKELLRFSILVMAFSFLIQTWGMFLRWLEAGYIEVAAFEKAIGHALSGWSFFVVFTEHPPWSNLYEIMIYMSWGIVLVTMFLEIKWQLRWVRELGLFLALLSLGVASLTDSSIKPLVPALKSWWIMIHVVSASIAYASGAIASIICLLALMRDTERITLKSFASFGLFAMGILLFLLAGGFRLVTDQAYLVKLLARAGEQIVNVVDLSEGGSQKPYSVPMPLVGWLFLLVCGAHFLGGIIILKNEKWLLITFKICFFLSLITFAFVLGHDLLKTKITLPAHMSHHLVPRGDWFIGFKSHSWSFSLLLIAIVIEAFLLLFLNNPELVRHRLPSTKHLELSAYKIITLAFFLMTVVLITGALWAHYAWGRYWAWDPKETGALAIWLNYGIYLHARRTSGLSGPVSSLIGIMGFFVIIVGFLGVNLGLFADGLHTYGNS